MLCLFQVRTHSPRATLVYMTGSPAEDAAFAAVEIGRGGKLRLLIANQVAIIKGRKVIT